jgi:hypothetical protein
VRSLLLAGAPCSSGSARRSASVRTGAVMWQGGERSGSFLTDAPCSTAAAAVMGPWHSSGGDGDDGIPAEAATTGSRRWRRALESLLWWSGGGSVRGK